MTLYIDGHIVQGKPEEIAEFLRLRGNDKVGNARMEQKWSNALEEFMKEPHIKPPSLYGNYV